MKDSLDLSCPVSTVKVDENVVRAVALEVLAITSLSLFLNNYYISLFLTFDFTLRAFTKGEYSLLKFIARQINTAFKIKSHPIDAAPKKFAAGVGIFFSLVIALFQFLQWYFAPYITGAVLLACAFLEGAFGFCVGCIVYTYVVLPFKKPVSSGQQ